MRAELKGISLDITGISAREYSPADPSCFTLHVTLLIGSEGSEGSDLFSINIHTPEWIRKCSEKHKVISGRHTLTVPNYDYDSLLSYLTVFCNNIEGKDWEEIAAQLSLFAHWEYDDASFKLNIIDCE